MLNKIHKQKETKNDYNITSLIKVTQQNILVNKMQLVSVGNRTHKQ